MLDEERDAMDDEELSEDIDLAADDGVDLGDDELFSEEEEGLSLSYGGAKGLDE